MKIRFLLAFGLLAAAPPAFAAKVGEVAPPFTVTTFAGEKISSEDLRGKVVILNYWATWCAPCRRELPEVDNYVRAHRGAPLAVYAITTEGSVPDYKLKPLAGVLSFPLASKLKGRGYGAIKRAVPTNYVIDKAGVIRHAEAGAFTAQTLDAVIAPLLAEGAAAGSGGRRTLEPGDRKSAYLILSNSA